MTDYNLTAADLADRAGYKDARTAREKATALGLGIDLKGRAGYRYSEADVQRLIESLRPAEPKPRRRKRRAA